MLFFNQKSSESNQTTVVKQTAAEKHVTMGRVTIQKDNAVPSTSGITAAVVHSEGAWCKAKPFQSDLSAVK